MGLIKLNLVNIIGMSLWSKSTKVVLQMVVSSVSTGCPTFMAFASLGLANKNQFCTLTVIDLPIWYFKLTFLYSTQLMMAESKCIPTPTRKKNLKFFYFLFSSSVIIKTSLENWIKSSISTNYFCFIFFLVKTFE